MLRFEALAKVLGLLASLTRCGMMSKQQTVRIVLARLTNQEDIGRSGILPSEVSAFAHLCSRVLANAVCPFVDWLKTVTFMLICD